MIDLHPDGILTRWFVWCCDHLPLTVTRDYGEGKPSHGSRRSGAYYLERGTTLCHVFWASLWVPLIGTALGTVLFCLFIFMHVALYRDKDNATGVWVAFIPEITVIAAVVPGAVVILAVMGAGKVGFIRLLWTYLKALKSRVCPLVKFGA